VSLREAIALAVNPGHRIVFDHSQFPQSIPLTLGELTVPASQSIFIDASDISGGVAINGINSSRIFNVDAGTSLAIRNVALVNGKAPEGASGGVGGDGGGIVSEGTLEVQSSTVSNNHAGNAGEATAGGKGGGVFSSGRSHFVDSVIAQNRAGDAGSSGGSGGDGGGLFNAGNMTLNRCTISGNHSGDGGTGFIPFDGQGGGLQNNSYLTLRACTVSNNTVERYAHGGGINSYANRLALYECTVSGNQANAGGGIDAQNVVLLVHTTLSGNRAVQASGGGNLGQGGGIEFYVVAPTLENSIVAGNQASPDSSLGPDIYNPANLTITTIGNNIVGDTSGSGNFSSPLFVIGNPRLTPLGNYGGPTQTMVPLPDSAALNAASVGSLTDQRGFARDATPDIGATEYRGYPDVALYWDGDFDNDGLKNGLELALGTDPIDPDRQNARNLRINFLGGHPHLFFGHDRPADLHFKWTVSRQINLTGGSALIYSYDETPSGASISQDGFIQVTGPTTRFDLYDSTPNQPRAFYTLTADILP
jgi:Bacterial TSP3 repeat